MNALSAEIVKLRRSLAWPVVVSLPVLLVLAGAVTRLSDGRAPEDGWHTVWLQSVGFYGVFPLAVGVAVLASLVWRVEHRGGNWNALTAGPVSTFRLVLAKAAVVAVLTAIMQLVLLLSVWAVGRAVFGLPGGPPGRYAGAVALLVVATVPLAATQSALSLFLRSFAGPVAAGLVLAGVSTAGLLVVGDPAVVSPYALATRTALLGTGALVDPGPVTAGVVATILVASAALTAVVLAVTVLVLDHRDART